MQKLLLSMAAALSTTAPVGAEAQEQKSSVAPAGMRAVAPALADYTDDVLFGDNWEGVMLSKRDRSIVTVSVLISTGKSPQLTGHLNRALDNGVKASELSGMITHLAFHTGWPNAVSATTILRKVFQQRGIGADQIPAAMMAPLSLNQPSEEERAGIVRDSTAPFAPNLARFTNETLFADLWRRPDLSPRDRSLVTIGALAATGEAAQLPVHIQRGLSNGLEQTELYEALTHLAFYAGWPKAMSAVAVARQTVAGGTNTDSAKNALLVARRGSGPVRTGLIANFTGTVRVIAPFQVQAPASAGGATVSFDAGARTAWHSHPLGQTLIVTDGVGWVQTDGSPIVELRVGDVAVVPPGVRHWHGASASRAMTHVAVAETLDGKAVEWFERVADAEYLAGLQTTGAD
jgi:4-carboxymuconolactone decarboxylase